MLSCIPARNQAVVMNSLPDDLDFKGLRVMCLASLQNWTESMRML